MVTGCLLSVFRLNTEAQVLTYSDSVEISLLTCSPGKEIWAQYGHTAIRYNDLKNNNDLAVNYGLFSQDQPYFILRFTFGLTDYRVGIEPMEDFLALHAYQGHGVIEQVLNLTKDEKFNIYKALEENLRPENVVYRYNFFYDNCTTRAGQILLSNIHGTIQTKEVSTQNNNTFRECIHEWNKSFVWSQFGEDLLLGVKADIPFKNKEKEDNFLPDNLRKSFDATMVNGRPLVKTTRRLLQKPANINNKEFPLSPLQISIIFAIIATIILGIQWKKKRMYLWWDLILMTVSGIIGLLLFAMIFSDHPCVNLNLIIFIFNPLCLIFLVPVVRNVKPGEKHWWWIVWSISICIGLLGTYFQRIPLPVIIVALFLLMNGIMHGIIFTSNKKIDNE